MAGVIPFSSGTPGRKQWDIKDKKSVSKLAKDGCPESQLVLGKQLLKEKSVVSVNGNVENASLAVFWLIKASEQGNVEATNILRSCLESGEGITEHNYLDVKTCLNTSQNEKLAKRAARELFLSLSAGRSFITSEQLRKTMRRVNACGGDAAKPKKICGKTECREKEKPGPSGDCSNGRSACNDACDYSDGTLDWSAGDGSFGEKFTEDHLENAAVTYARGELPLVQRVLALSDADNREIQNLNYLHRAVLHPLQTVHESYLKLLDHFVARYGNAPFAFVPTASHVQILLLLLLLLAAYPTLVNFENAVIVAATSLYFLSFFVMVLSTVQMLQSKREYANFRAWSRLFLRYDRDGNLNTDDAEFEYCKKNLRPFLAFFVSLLVNLVAYPFISDMWLPESEFAVVAFALTFATLYFFPHDRVSSARKPDLLTLFSFAVVVLAKYPYETDGVVRRTWRFLDAELPSLHGYDLPCFASQIIGHGVQFCLNFHGFFYLLMPVIFVKMASRDNWKGTYKVLIPHCVTLSWWQIAVLCCQGATLYGLIRSTLALVGLIFFLPIVGIATVILPVVAVMKHFTDLTLTPRTGLTTILAAVPLVICYFIDKRRGLQFGMYLSKVQIFLAVVSAFFLLCPSVNEFFADESEMQATSAATLTWDQYSSLCRKTSWNKRTVADIQKDCVHFHGASVNWEGVVEDVRIVKVTNAFLKVVDHLPRAARSKLICLYGEEYEEECENAADEARTMFCRTVKEVHSRSRCHVKSWDKYDFEIKLRMKSNAWNDAESAIRLEADDSLRNFTFGLRTKDHVWFTGTLARAETLGDGQPSVFVDEVGCISCENKDLTSARRHGSKLSPENLLGEVGNGVKRILNFVFSPVLMFR